MEKSEAVPVGEKMYSLQHLDVDQDLDADVAHHRKGALEMVSNTRESTSKSRSQSTRAKKVKITLMGFLPCAGLCLTLLDSAT